MSDKKETARPVIAAHGATILPSVEVLSYNIELKDGDDFLGDRASKKALHAIIDKWRKPLRKEGRDPFGDTPSEELGKKALDDALVNGDSETAGVVHAVVEDFAQELAFILKRLLKTKSWKDVERIAMGGGMREHRIGELAIGRTNLLLKADGIKIDLEPIHFEPDDAGLIGALHMAPSWIFSGHNAILAADIGGTNMRAGLVRMNNKKATDFSKAEVVESLIWRHADEKTTRDKAVESLIEMFEKLLKRAKKDELKLAPFIGVGCPGRIEADGAIDRGAQNLPGNWESAKFNLPGCIAEAIPKIGDHETVVIMHNDAVVQGLSEIPFMQDCKSWGILTLGTGLGNACFANRKED
jgi:hypothetical protein